MILLDEQLIWYNDVRVVVSLISLLVSIASFGVSAWNFQNFARNEFVKKQIQVVADLVIHIHDNPIQVSFKKYLDNGSSSLTFNSTIFEYSNIDLSNHFENSSDIF